MDDSLEIDVETLSDENTPKKPRRIINKKIPTNEAVNETANEAINDTANETANEAINDTANEETNETANEAINETANEAINETANEIANEAINDTANEETNETANEAINETVNKETDETAKVATNSTGKPKFFQLPVARIKNLMKMDPDCSIISQDALILVTKATELFIELLATESFKQTAQTSRKTILGRDVECAINAVPHLCFLDGALE